AEFVYKTFVASAGTDHYYVFVVPVAKELNLKKAAKAAGEKKIEMIAMKDLLGVTGYIRGGCSPIGMKKRFPTFIDRSAETLEFMIVSAGKIGKQLTAA
ncbi:YbaK/EbsC family protein, partial [Bacillus velezensis]